MNYLTNKGIVGDTFIWGSFEGLGVFPSTPINGVSPFPPPEPLPCSFCLSFLTLAWQYLTLCCIMSFSTHLSQEVADIPKVSQALLCPEACLVLNEYLLNGGVPFLLWLSCCTASRKWWSDRTLATTTAESLVRMRGVGRKKQRQDSLVLDGS